eukprot:scaffold18475_cov106-Cyclotella_meneghiniana.AAC.3
MADPGPVASVFWLDDALDSRLRLDGIVGVVDVVNILKQLEDTSSLNHHDDDGNNNRALDNGHGDEAARQIALADRIICNKIDLLGDETRSSGIDHDDDDDHDDNKHNHPAIQSVLDTIKVINPTAPTILTTYSTVQDITWVLDTQCFDPERVREIEASYEQLIMSRQFCGLCTDDNSSNNNNSSNSSAAPVIRKHRHTSAITTIALFQIGSVDLHKLNLWLASILWPNQDEKDSVLRARLEQNMNDCTERKTEMTPPNKSANDQQKQQQHIYRIKGVISVSHSSMIG